MSHDLIVVDLVEAAELEGLLGGMEATSDALFGGDEAGRVSEKLRAFFSDVQDAFRWNFSMDEMAVTGTGWRNGNRCF